MRRTRPYKLITALGAVMGLSGPVAAQETVMVPVGTRIMVRTVETLSSASHESGARFTLVLDAAIAVNGQIVVPAGAKVYGRITDSRRGGRLARRAKLAGTLTDIEIGGVLHPIVTDEVGAEGGPQGTLAKVGAGALIGAAAGDAAAGAAAGGGAALLTRGNQIQIPSKTLAEFHLTQPASLPSVSAAAAALAQPPAQAAQPTPTPAPDTPVTPGTIPAGTRLMIRTVDAIGSHTHKAGARFSVVLDAPLTMGSTVIAPAGATAYGTVKEARPAGRVARRAKLVITLTDITLNGQLVPIVTNDAGAEGGPSGTVARVGAGALIGAAAGGAAEGAAVGGALSLLTPGNQIVVPPKTLVEFRTTQPVVVP